MKIFSNFDTNQDIKIFNKKLDEFGDDKVILGKRHPLYLYKTFLLGGLLIFVLLLGSYINYLLFSNNLELFYMIIVLNLSGIFFWLIVLFTNIIRSLFNYKEFIFRRSDIRYIDIKNFDFFLKFSFFIFFYEILISFADLYLIFNTDININSYYLLVGAQLVLIIAFVYLMFKILFRFINFEMDFFIITPRDIEAFDQRGLFKRKTVTISMVNIRSITADKKGIIQSIFNFGSLIVLSEGDRDKHGEITFNYIHKLGALKSSIYRLMHDKKIIKK